MGWPPAWHSVCMIKLQTSLWYCVLNRNNTWVWEPRDRSRSDSTYYHTQRSTERFCVFCPNSWLRRVRGPSPQRDHTFANGYSKDPIELQDAAAARVLWNLCAGSSRWKESPFSKGNWSLISRRAAFAQWGQGGYTHGSRMIYLGVSQCSPALL